MKAIKVEKAKVAGGKPLHIRASFHNYGRIAFMGIGVVDPLLPLIGREMGATPFQVEWLFTSYIAVMSFSSLPAEIPTIIERAVDVKKAFAGNPHMELFSYMQVNLLVT